jgi:hypothetical protein
MVDLDNDGSPDLLFVTGSVYPEVERKLPQYPYKTPRVLFRNLGNGAFEEIEQAGEGIATPHSSRGCAFGDFDNDTPDVLIVNMNSCCSLCVHLKPGQNWLKIKLEWGEVDRRAIGPGRGPLNGAGASALSRPVLPCTIPGSTSGCKRLRMRP